MDSGLGSVGRGGVQGAGGPSSSGNVRPIIVDKTSLVAKQVALGSEKNVGSGDGVISRIKKALSRTATQGYEYKSETGIGDEKGSKELVIIGLREQNGQKQDAVISYKEIRNSKGATIYRHTTSNGQDMDFGSLKKMADAFINWHKSQKT